MQGGLSKYNAYQKALSSYLKESGVSLKLSGKKFHEVASTLYRQTKTAPLKHTLNNIDALTQNIIAPPITVPELTSNLIQGFPFYDFSDNYEEFVAPNNLLVNSFTVSEQEILAPAFNYENGMKKFTKFCNDEAGLSWSGSGEAPIIMFTPPEPHPTQKGMYITNLISGDPNNYGFVPDEEDLEFIAPISTEEETPELPTEETQPDTTKEDKIAKAKERAEERAIAIKKLDVKSKKLDVKMQKQNIQLFDRYENLYNKGILTKAEFKQKVMELKL